MRNCIATPPMGSCSSRTPNTPGSTGPRHDHGRGWVIYAMQQGEIEMGTYARVEDPDGQVRLVKRDSTLVRAGQVQVYLPGDIHDTRCMTERPCSSASRNET